ncbi:MAG: hypothetical protein ACXVO1_04915, partial [Tumebacillaceae bacterium]
LKVQLDLIKIYVEIGDYKSAYELAEELEKCEELLEYQMRELILYKAEVTKALLDGQVKVANNLWGPDTVDVTGLKKGDVIKVYDANGKLLNASAAVGTGKNSVSISISQLGAGVGFVNVSITSSGWLESDPLKVTYAAEQNATI